MSHTPIRSQLARHQPQELMSDDDLRRYARAAYHERNIAVIWLDEVRDDFQRQAIINEADKQHGKKLTNTVINNGLGGPAGVRVGSGNERRRP